MKTLKQVVEEIKGHGVTNLESRRFAEAEFAQLYAWIKADVVANLLKENVNLNKN